MGSSSLELSLGVKPTYVPKTMSNLLKDLSNITSESKKLSVLNDYLLEHQEELGRVRASFQSKELPQCVLLLMEAIETLKEEMAKIKMDMVSARSSGKAPLMEFLPITGKGHGEDYQREILSQKESAESGGFISPLAQIGSRSTNHERTQKSPLDNIRQLSQKPLQPCITRNKTKIPPFYMPPRGSSRGNPTGPIGHGSLNLKTDPRTLNYHPKPLTQPIWKNKRRAWSPELHDRFVEAMNLLGGIEVATPKQIKEVMQVDGLTNDQVKSHLQKYRLHYRMLPEYTNPANQSANQLANQSANQGDYRVPDLYHNDFLMPSTSHYNQAQEAHPDNHVLAGGTPPLNSADYLGNEMGRLI